MTSSNFKNFPRENYFDAYVTSMQAFTWAFASNHGKSCATSYILAETITILSASFRKGIKLPLFWSKLSCLEINLTAYEYFYKKIYASNSHDMGSLAMRLLFFVLLSSSYMIASREWLISINFFDISLKISTSLKSILIS